MGIAIKDGKGADGKPVTTWEVARWSGRTRLSRSTGAITSSWNGWWSHWRRRSRSSCSGSG